jgi:hypothetical protein
LFSESTAENNDTGRRIMSYDATKTLTEMHTDAHRHSRILGGLHNEKSTLDYEYNRAEMEDLTAEIVENEALLLPIAEDFFAAMEAEGKKLPKCCGDLTCRVQQIKDYRERWGVRA